MQNRAITEVSKRSIFAKFEQIFDYFHVEHNFYPLGNDFHFEGHTKGLSHKN